MAHYYAQRSQTQGLYVHDVCPLDVERVLKRPHSCSAGQMMDRFVGGLIRNQGADPVPPALPVLPNPQPKPHSLKAKPLRAVRGQVSPCLSAIAPCAFAHSPQPEPHRQVEPNDRICPFGPIGVGGRQTSFDDPPLLCFNNCDQRQLVRLSALRPAGFL